MHIAIVTAGGAGMFCGSCMHDNTLARALMDAGADVSLLPTYTPIRLDETDNSDKSVHLGGINVYLQSRSRLWRKLPTVLKGWLDARWAINLATSFGVSNDAHKLGELTLDMLAGESGSQRRGIEELAEHLTQLKPDVVCFSNALLSGALRTLRAGFDGPVLCLLQGDDVFLQDLPEPYRGRAIDAARERTAEFDGYLVHSNYYRDFMSDYLRLPSAKFHRVPLGISLSGHDGLPGPRNNARFTVGFFARICPEKGLHNLVEGFRRFHANHPDSRLKSGGSLSKRDAKYLKTIKANAKDLGGAFEHIGSPPTHREKVEFLNSLDVLSVPTSYHEPKGLPVLEALANGVPVVQPRHGAFPELIEATGGGLLVNPEDPDDLAAALAELYRSAEKRRALGETGRANVHKHFGPETMANATLAVFRNVLKLQSDADPLAETASAELRETIRDGECMAGCE
ncbi:MAG: glycosyltransferase family 4 protein [Planctomycetaceae bacterium]